VTKPTPGPWETYVSTMPVGRQRFACIQPAEGIKRRIADVMLHDDQAEADARLIAAAPDLLAALRETSDILRVLACLAKGSDLSAIQKQYAANRKAIAKAEGRDES